MENVVIFKKIIGKYSNIFWQDLKKYGVFLFPLPLFIYLSRHNFISHSELWSISSAHFFGSLSPEALITYIRPAFFSILSIPYFFELTNTEHILLARSLFGILASLNLLLVYKLVRALNWKKSQGLIFCSFLLSFHVFFYNFYRVRSDFLALTVALICLIRILKPRKFYLTKLRFDPTLPFLSFLLILTTPKALYFLIMISATYFLVNYPQKKVPRTFYEILLLLVMPAAGIVIFLQFSGVHSGHFENIYAIVLNYYYQSFSEALKPESLGAVFRTLKINFLNYSLIGLGFCLILLKKKTRKDYLSFLLFFSALAALVVHPERWDYFIASLLPFLALPFLYFLASIKKNWQKIVLVFSCPLLAVYMTFFSGWLYSNKIQLQQVEHLSLILDHFPEAQIFDATGIAPRANNFQWFLGPNDLFGNLNTVNLVEQRKPEFILYTPKLIFGGPRLIIILHKYYDEVRPGFWVKNSLVFKFKEVHFPDWNYNLGSPFIYDHHPKIRFFK